MSERAVDAVAAALRRHGGDDPLDLIVGTPCFDPPGELLASLARAAGEPHFDYAPSRGTPGAREAIAALHRAQGEEVGAEQVFVTQGAKLAVLAVLACTVGAGDEVVVPTPAYPPYGSLPEMLGARAVPVPREPPGFAFDVGRIEAAVTPRTRAVVVASPCNPTGATLDSASMGALVELCRSRGLRLLLDEAYEAFRFAPDSVSSPHALDPGGETAWRIRSFSKTYGLCGWRTGWIVASPESAGRLARFQAANLNPANTLMQRAIEAAPRVPPAFHEAARRAVLARHEAIAAALEGTGLGITVPAGGFYLLADARDALDRTGHATSLDFAVALAESEGVALWPGEDYRAPATLRLSSVALADPARAPELGARLRRFVGA